MKRALLNIVFSFIFLNLNGQAAFKADLTKGCGPLFVQFTDMSKRAANWYWDLGNGNTSTVQNPTAIYTNPGKYTISLKIVDSSGSIYNESKNAYITVFTGPAAAFTSDVRKICPNSLAYFQENCKAGDTTLASWSWDFGDGNTGSKASISHAWTVPGYKTVTLIVTDKNGCSDKLQSNSYMKVITPPLPDFYLDSGFSCKKGLKVNFTNTSTPSGLSYTWDFGDGTATSNLTDPFHFYSKYGSYNVSLTAKDNNTGCVNKKTVSQAVIIDSLIVDFDTKDKLICDAGKEVAFTNLVPYFADYKATWKFGDGNTSAAWSPSYVYPANGSYSVTLEIKGSKCFASKTKVNLVKVTSRPPLNIRANDTNACKLPFNIKFFAKTNGTSTVFWDYGDNASGSGKAVNHSYQSPDTFNVRAIAIDATGCRDTQYLQTKMNSILASVTGLTEGCAPFTSNMQFKIWETSAPIVLSEWYMGNKRIDSGSTCKFVFTDTGNYKLQIRVKNSKGCVDSSYTKIPVGLKIKPSFTVDKHKVCLYDSVTFTNTTPSTPVRAHNFSWYLGEGSVMYGNSVTYRYTTSQGNVRVVLTSKHYGCKDTFSSADSMLILTPRCQYTMPQIGCNPPAILKLVNHTTAYNRFKWTATPAAINSTNDTMYLDLKTSSYYSVKMVAFNDTTGCADSAKFDFNFKGNQPDARAFYVIEKPCPPARIVFYDSLSGGKELYWKTPSGDTLRNTTVLAFTASDYGTYTCTRYAVNKYPFQTCVDSAVMKIVLPKPDARFSVSPSKGCTPVVANFADSGYFAGKKGIWKFGDTSIPVTGKNTAFTFHYPFDSLKTPVTYTAWDSLQKCSATYNTTVEISGPDALIQAGYFYTCKLTKLQLSFIKISKGIKSWEWYADDTFLGTSPSLDYLVYATRWVKVKLKITDSSGCTSSIFKNVFVRMYRPDVKISSDTAGALCPPLVVRFNDASSAFNSPIETWLWDFGDGSSSTLKNPSHAFLNTGVYNIKLTVKSFLGCFATKTFPAYIRIYGPTGNIFSTRDSGCTPFRTTLYTNAGPLKSIRWDYGDGTEGNGEMSPHTYKNAGKFTPSAIFEDSNGCTLGVQAAFKIRTNPSPVAKIKQNSFCENGILSFTDSSDYGFATPKNNWIYAATTASGKTFSFSSVKNSPDAFQLVAFGNLGCNDTLNFTPYKSYIRPDFIASKDTACLGESISFTDKSKSDTALTYWNWKFQGNNFSGKLISALTAVKGPSDADLTVQNAFGCTENLLKINRIFTGDTLPPAAPSILSVSVISDLSQSLKYTPETSADWRKYTFYHTQPGPQIFAGTEFTQSKNYKTFYGWDATQNPQCFVLTQTNVCLRESNAISLFPHCTVELRAMPSNNQILLSWSPYVGQPVNRYVIQRAQVNTLLFQNIDSVNGTTLAYSDTTPFCSNRYTYRICARLQNLETSFSDTAQAAAIHSFKFSNPHFHHITNETGKTLDLVFEPLPTNQIKYYTIKRADASFVYTNIKSIPAAGPFSFTETGIRPDQKQYFYTVSATDVCGADGPESAVSGNILLQFNTRNNGDIQLWWNAYRHWTGGVDHYEIEQENQNGNFIPVQQTIDTFFNLNQPGAICGSMPRFRVKAVSRINPGFTDSLPTFSHSNLILLADKPSFFIPNSFTPNDDNLNKGFRPSLYWSSNLEMEIYNRWGQLIYTGSGCEATWDGTYNGKPAPDGVYVYKMKITGTNGKFYYPSGTVNLIR